MNSTSCIGDSLVRVTKHNEEGPKQELLLQYMTSFASFLQDLASQSSGPNGWSLWGWSGGGPAWRKKLDGPSLLEVGLAEQQNLMARKLDLCSVPGDFTEEGLEREVEVKTATLEEILDFVEQNFSNCTRAMLVDIACMVERNICRILSPGNYVGYFEEDESDSYEDPSWDHLSIVYKIFLKILEQPQFEPNSLRTIIHRRFISRFFNLFESSDPREREYLKTVLHRIYGNFLVLRSFIRDRISNFCLSFIEDDQRRSVGISEVLEVMGAIIKGLTLPLKAEHLQFLDKVLIPLHKEHSLETFSPQLTYCIVQMILKDQRLASRVVAGLLRLWPRTDESRQVHFLAELVSLLEVTRRLELQKVAEKILLRVGESVSSIHYQVAQKALEMWESACFINLIKDNQQLAQRILTPCLQR